MAVCKAFVYGLSLSAFRGGPVFPAMFIGAVLGVAVAGLPGMSLAPAIAIGIERCARDVRCPDLGLLATLLLGPTGVGRRPQFVSRSSWRSSSPQFLPVPGSTEPSHLTP